MDGAPLGVAGWRWMFAIGSLGALLTFLVRRGLPESPRWLESVGRTAEADAVTSRFEKAAEAEGWTPPRAPARPSSRRTPGLRSSRCRSGPSSVGRWPAAR
ncbi:MFS transporter [Streptomyces indonesiensis]